MIAPENLREVRERLNETQQIFADRIGVNQGTLSRWESGRLPKKGVAQALLRRVLEDIERVYPIETKA